MDRTADAPTTNNRGMIVERRSDHELAVTRTFDAPVARVFDAWAVPELFAHWWPPKSMGFPLRSCEMDVRTGGSYRLVFGHDAESAMAFFGTYLDVVPPARLAWTNEEEGGGAVTTVTFEEHGQQTLLTFHERHPSTEARDEACAGMEGALGEQFAQLDALLAASA